MSISSPPLTLVLAEHGFTFRAPLSLFVKWSNRTWLRAAERMTRSAAKVPSPVPATQTALSEVSRARQAAGKLQNQQEMGIGPPRRTLALCPPGRDPVDMAAPAWASGGQRCRAGAETGAEHSCCAQTSSHLKARKELDLGPEHPAGSLPGWDFAQGSAPAWATASPL